MMQCVATFHSHFGAVRFSRDMNRNGVKCILKPVPRTVSSSCGTCAQFESELPTSYVNDDVEGIYVVQDDSYRAVWEREED